MNKRALIVGGAGFLGGHLCDKLLSKGYKCLCIDIKGCNSSYLDKIGVPVVFGDISDMASIEKHINPGDTVFHLAAFLGKAKVSKEKFYEINVDGAVNVLQAAINKKAGTFVFPSSMAAVGPVGSVKKPMTEKTECKPVTLYGKTKLEAEIKIKELAGDKITCIIFRPPPFFGPRFNPITSSAILFKTMMKKTIALIGNTKNYFPLCYVKNFAHAMVTVSENKKQGIHTYLISDDEPVKFIDILMILRSKLGKNERIIHIPYVVAYCIAWVIGLAGKIFKFTPLLTTDIVDGMARSVYYHDISKIKNDGYRKEYTLEQAIEETAVWYKEKISNTD